MATRDKASNAKLATLLLFHDSRQPKGGPRGEGICGKEQSTGGKSVKYRLKSVTKISRKMSCHNVWCQNQRDFKMWPPLKCSERDFMRFSSIGLKVKRFLALQRGKIAKT